MGDRVIPIPDRDEVGNEGFVAEVEELPGGYSQGRTVEEAYRKVHDATAGWISIALADGQAVPERRESSVFSGKFVVRPPKTLHGELVRDAEWEDVSLNQFVSSALAGAIGWHRKGKPQFVVRSVGERRTRSYNTVSEPD